MAVAAELGDTEFLPGPRSLWAESRGPELGGLPEAGLWDPPGVSPIMCLSWDLQMGVLVTWVERRQGVLHSKEPRGAGKTGRLAWHNLPQSLSVVWMEGEKKEGREGMRER